MIPPNLFFFDIETLPTDRPDLIADISASVTPPGSMKKAETLARWEAEERPAAVAEAISKTSLDDGTGRLASVAWTGGADPDIVAGTFVGSNGYDEATERDLITGFFAEADGRAKDLGTPPRSSAITSAGSTSGGSGSARSSSASVSPIGGLSLRSRGTLKRSRTAWSCGKKPEGGSRKTGSQGRWAFAARALSTDRRSRRFGRPVASRTSENTTQTMCRRLVRFGVASPARTTPSRT